MRKNRKKYDSSVIGTVVEVRSRGMDYPTRIVVEYTVDGKIYTVSETIRLKSRSVKAGFLPVGQKKTPVMGDTRVGAGAEVLYRREKPSDAVIKENRGIQNI